MVISLDTTTIGIIVVVVLLIYLGWSKNSKYVPGVNAPINHNSKYVPGVVAPVIHNSKYVPGVDAPSKLSAPAVPFGNLPTDIPSFPAEVNIVNWPNAPQTPQDALTWRGTAMV